MAIRLLSRKSVARTAFVGLAAATLAVAGGGVSAAATETGWVGGTVPIGGVVYLHASTITNAPALSASTAIYPSFGQMVPDFRMGVQSRLFKSGVLCKITPWQYNPISTSRLENRTSGDCGTGSYNSHGFVQASDGTNWSNYVTFPTNPLDYVAPAPLAKNSAPTTAAANLSAGTNTDGTTYGPAGGITEAEDIPDLVASYGSDGTFGYVKASDLNDAKSNGNIPLYERDGRTVIGSFGLN